MDDRILEELKKSTDDIEVPGSLTPESIREKLDGIDEKNYKKKIKKYPTKRIVAAASAAVVLIAGIGITSVRLHDDGGSAIPESGVTAVVEDDEEKLSYDIPGVMHSAKSYEDVTDVIETARADMEKEQILFTIKNGVSFSRDYMDTADGGVPAMVESVDEADMSGAEAASNDAGGDSVDYSRTNVRTADVDEGDVVKTDGKYIYQYFSSGRLRIVAIDDGQMQEVYSGDIMDGGDGYVSEMYVRDDKLIVIYEAYDTSMSMGDYEYYSVTDEESVHAVTYDITDRNKPRSLGEVIIDGTYQTSRLVDGYLYVMTSFGQPLYYLYDFYDDDTTYVYDEDTAASDADASKDAADNGLDGVIPKINGQRIAAEDIMIPEKPQNEPFYTITSISLDAPSETVDTKSVMGYVDQVYASVDSLFFYSTDWSGRYERTQIVKFSYGGGRIVPEAAGSVRGSVDDSFCIDEDGDGNLRVATTTWMDDGSQESSLYILDNNLKKIGSLKDIAGNEGVKSCRFMGDIGYIVTFRNTDPLFTIDLSDPANPVILSELTIPGFSEYLHYYGDGLLLGIGYDADVETGGTTGVKLSMFDVSDSKNTKEIAKMVIDVDSVEALYGGYKSILIDPDKNIFGFVASDWGDESNDWAGSAYYMLFSYEDGEFHELTTERLEDGYGTGNVRGVYAGEYFYLVNEDYIKSFDMTDYKKVAELKYTSYR